MRARVSLAAAILLCGNQLGRSKPVISQPLLAPVQPAAAMAAPFWVVEETASRVLYSNGLSISREYETESSPRRYKTFRSDSSEPSAVETKPSGIVFHTTESEIHPLEASQNGALVRTREEVLAHVRNGRSYNFVIDRFGQVYRIVPEGQTAFHAGHSVWASNNTVWIDLNESFLGISFEAQSSGAFQPSAAQIHSGRLLTEVLRQKYGISDAACVTHAQVSVNPDNMRIGYHTDWGSSFPFAAIGLTQGYQLPVAAVAVFGFRYDESFLQAIEQKIWPGLLLANNEVMQRATREGITANELRIRLQQKYKALRRPRNE